MSALLAPNDLARMTAAIDQSHADTCAVSRRTTVSDGAGGTTDTWAQVASNLPCRISAFMGRKGGTEFATLGLLEGIVYWRIALEIGTNVTAADRLVTASRTFEVVGVDTPATWAIETRAYCLERT